jgi:hypothetical protein
MVTPMNHLAERLQTVTSRLARRWMQTFPRFSFRIILVVLFAAFVLFNTRQSETRIKLAADRLTVPQSSYAAPPALVKPRVYAWLSSRSMAKTAPLAERIEPPPGFERLPVPAGSFADWLRHLPTWPAGTPVTTAKRKTVIQPDDPSLAAVVALQPGSARVLNASNMLIRLRGEYLWAAGALDDAAFHFTSGHAAQWDVWAQGQRPVVQGRKVEFRPERPADAGRESFCSYLETVFQFSSPYSILNDTRPVEDGTISPGDIFLNPSPKKGYAVLVLDVARALEAADDQASDGSSSGGAVRVMLGAGGNPRRPSASCAAPTALPGSPSPARAT